MSEFAFLTLVTLLVLVIGVIWLVHSARRPGSDEVDPDDMAVLTDARDELEAKVLASKVNAFGIRTFVRNRHGPILYGFPPSFVGWEVLVRQGDLDEGRRLLDLDPEHEFDDSESEQIEVDAERY